MKLEELENMLKKAIYLWNKIMFPNPNQLTLSFVVKVKAERSPSPPLYYNADTLLYNSFKAQSDISINGSNINEFICILSGVIKFTSSITSF